MNKAKRVIVGYEILLFRVRAATLLL